jgi:hypothetical protein
MADTPQSSHSEHTAEDAALKAKVNAALGSSGLSVHIWRRAASTAADLPEHVAVVSLGGLRSPAYRQTHPFTDLELVKAARNWRGRVVEAQDNLDKWTSSQEEADRTPDGWPKPHEWPPDDDLDDL